MSARQNFTRSAIRGRQSSPAPFSLRLSADERARLEAAAGGTPLGAFIRERLLDGELTPRRTRGREPVSDHAELGHVLGALGRSRLASNLNQIAKLAHMGALPLSPDVEADLRAACIAVHEMRTALLAALGVREGGAP